MARSILLKCGCFSFDLINITVEPVLFLYMFSGFLSFTGMQALIFTKVCQENLTAQICDQLRHNHTYKEEHREENDHIYSETSYWILKTNLALTIPSFVVVVVFLGSLGDKYGRKLPVILPCIGALVTYVSMLLNAHYMSAPLEYILIGPIINGLCGGYASCLMAVYSYVSHVSTSNNRLIRIGIVESMIFLSGSIGVLVSGAMIDNKGFIFTFSACSISIGIALLYALIWLDNVKKSAPETQSENENGKEKIGTVVVRSFCDSFKCVTKRREGNKFCLIVLQVVAINTLMLCKSGDMDISMLYLTDFFGFSLTLFGYLKGLDNFLRGLIMVTFVPIIKKLTSVSDMPLMILGLLSYASSFILTGSANKQWMIFFAVVTGMFQGIPSAGFRSSLSTLVSVEEQGRLFGLVSATESLVSLLASVVFNVLYPATLEIYPGLCYLLGGALILLIIGLVIYVRCVISRHISDPVYKSLKEEPVSGGEAVLVYPTGDDVEDIS